MKKLLFILLFFHSILVAESITDCTKVFEERKAELQKEIEKIDDERQAYEALRTANNALLDKKREAVEQEEIRVKSLMDEVKKEQEVLAKAKEENQKLLASIDDIKNNKIGEAYNKMKEGAAAAIMESLEREEAASILFVLPPKKVSKIMAKMDPKIASEVTVLLTQGPPFEIRTTIKDD